jgi:hypothetical protein
MTIHELDSERNLMTLITKILVCVTIIGLWAWVAADDWEHEQEVERAEQQRIQAIEQYHKSQSLQSPALSEDEVDVTPAPTVEPEPTFVSAPVQTAKKRVVQAKKRIKKTVNKNSGK